jgi:hypothetical protein
MLFKCFHANFWEDTWRYIQYEGYTVLLLNLNIYRNLTLAETTTIAIHFKSNKTGYIQLQDSLCY